MTVKERGRCEKRGAVEGLSDLARKAATRRPPSSEVGEPERFCGFEPLPNRGGAVSNELIERLREGGLE